MTYTKFTLYFFCFFIYVNSQTLKGQNTKRVDSMKNILKTQKGNAELKTLYELAWDLQEEKDSVAIRYAIQKLTLSKKVKNDSSQVDALNILGKIAKNQYKYEDAEKYFLEAVSLAEMHSYKHGIARGYNELGLFYRDQGNNIASIDAFLKSCESFKAQGKLKRLAKIHANLGNIYKKIEAYSEALKHYLKCLDLREELQDSLGLARIYRDLGTLSKYRGNYDEMLKYSLKSKLLFEKLKLHTDVFDVAVQVAESYDYLNENEKSKEVYLETLQLIPVYEIEDASNLYHNFATLYKKIGEKDSALYYYEKAQKIFKEDKDFKRLSKNYNNLGNLYKAIGNKEKALANFNKSLKLQKAVQDFSLLEKTYNSISVLYKENKEFSKAYAYKDSSSSIRNKIYESVKKADIYELAYEKEKRQVEIANKKTELLALNTKRNNQIIAVVLIALGVLFFVLLRARKLKEQKKVAELAFEKQKIKAQLEKEQQEKKLEEMLQDQERKAITSMITGQEEERERIAKDLHDRLGSMLSVVKIHYKSVEEDLEKIKNETKSQYEKANQLLDEACETVRKIAHNMVSGTLTKFGLIPALKELKQKIEETKILEVELLAHGMDNRLNNSTEIQLYRIIQELLNNILKHAEASEVTIQLLKREEDLNIMVSDNGIGFNVDTKEFEGMGLKSIKARVAEMNGHVLIDSSKGNGTTVTIEIPTKK